MNLLQETIECLCMYKKTCEDVLWCGSYDYGYFSWNDFSAIADIEYDDGFGAAEISKDLLIVGDDWWMERYEYDGSEGWSFKRLPKKPDEENIPSTFCNGGMWEDLTEMNKEPAND